MPRTATSAPAISGIAMIAAGVMFTLYPLIRGFGSEERRAGAEMFAALSWMAAHLCAMVGSVLIAVALRFLPSAGSALELTAWLAASFLLPYYGAEAYGLNALGHWARDNANYDALQIADGFRYAPVPMITFGIGWILLAAVGIALIVQAARDRGGPAMNRLGAAISGFGLTVFLPVFFVPGVLRIAHGIVLAVGLIIWGVAVLIGNQPTSRLRGKTADEADPSRRYRQSSSLP
ncbi:hypothetical protein ABLE94_12040 [Gordonia sp. VNK1]|uniref:hypothetical protein n=1 Tax=Gordonia oleivorans TaxID=3156618 RepID=UPI0032B51145